MSAAAVRAARPGIVLREAPGPSDETVLYGGGEVFRLPRTPAAAARVLLAVRVLARLRALVPVPLPAPRPVGMLADGVTAFTAERRLPGAPLVGAPGGIAAGQLAGLLAALDAVPLREAQQWGAAGEGVLLHGDLSRRTLLVDARRGVLTGVVGWAPRLGPRGDDLAGLDPVLRAALG